MPCQWGYGNFVRVLVICLVQELAGRQINFEGLAFVIKAILKQNTLDPAISQLYPPLPLNNPQILEKKNSDSFKTLDDLLEHDSL